MNKQLEVRDAVVAYGSKPVVRNIGFSLAPGEIGCLLGPSGCGKTTVLRAIAGFEPLSAGEIQLRGRSVSRPGATLAPEHRRVGMVFQDFALYPHLSVEKNVAFGLRSLPRRQQQARVDELLSLVGLSNVRKRFPHELSGGQQQRVALIRAMAPRPDVLLLDEPFSSMDVDLREQLARELRKILKRESATAVLVTHDQLEAFAMADEIGVIAEGSLHQWARGYELYHQPADRFVADFIGQGVMLPGWRNSNGVVETELGPIAGIGELDSSEHAVDVLLRPDDLVHDDASPLQAEVTARAFRGAEYLYSLRLKSGSEVLCLVQSHHDHAIGEKIGIRLDVKHLVAFPSQV